MQPAPAIFVSIERFGAWRAIVLGIGATFTAVMTAWCVTMAAAHQAAPGWSVAWTVLNAAAWWVLCGLLKTEPLALRWDTQCWLLGHDGERRGDVTLMIDLGAWMLLRFVDAAHASTARRAAWIPVQRAGLETRWHALRCAVYSPRPEAGGSPLIPLEHASNRSNAAE